MDQLLNQLLAAGMNEKKARAAIHAATKMSAIDGANHLKDCGAQYLLAYRFLGDSALHARNARAENSASSPGSSPAALIGLGIVVGACGYAATRYADRLGEGPNVAMIDLGGMAVVVAGGLFALMGFIKWMRG